MNHVESFEHNGLNIKLYPDYDPMNPRDDDNLGTMYCQHGSYNLGDKDALPAMEEYIYLPLYLYDHSGITMSTEPFPCPWDSGMVGYIYVTLDDVRAEYGSITPEVEEKVLNALHSEVDAYDKYIRGEAYGYVVEAENGDPVDSCWGFDDLDYCRKEAVNAADYELERESAA